jgi:DNA-binding NarL/FixJ family response regulator
MYRIILADNQSIFRNGLAEVLSTEANFHVAAQCGSTDFLYKVLPAFPEATVLFASTLTQEPGLLMQQICSRGSRGIAILENGEPKHTYLAAQVHGLFFRSITAPSLLQGVCRVARGEGAFQSGWKTAASLDEDLVGTRVRDQLTQSEMKIMALIGQGWRNKHIALQFHTTEQVIKNSLTCIYGKTGFSDRLELALFITQHRILAEAVAAAGDLLIASN